MWNLSGRKILPREESRIVADQTIASRHERARRKTCAGHEKRTIAAREICQALARHVDFAAAKWKLEKKRRDLPRSLPIHESPNHASDFSLGETEDRQSLSALVFEKRSHVNSHSLSASAGN